MANSKNADLESTSPDGGWGWMVAIGCAIILFLMPLLTLCFAILFSGFLLDHKVSSTTTAWIFNTHTLLWNVMGPFIGPLSKEFGFRNLSLTGAMMASACVFACSFTTSTAYLLVFFSLSGLFGGLTCKPCYLIIPLYFDKRRGMANAILMGGMCAGQFAGPPFIRFLLRNYGFTGATIIVSSIILNCCIGASLFQPVEWYSKCIHPSAHSISIVVTQEKSPHEETTSLVKEKEGCDWERTNSVRDLQIVNKVVLRNRLRRASENSVAVSMVDLSSAGISHQIEDKPAPTQQPSRSLPVRVIKSLISDLGILRYHRAKIIAFGGLFFINGYLNFMMVVPFAVQNVGFTPEDAAWCVSITGISNFIARLSASTLSDHSWFNMKIVYVVGAIIVALASATFSFLEDLTLMKVTLGVWALGIGINISLYPLVMANVMGVENMPAIFGTQSLVVGLGNVTLGPLIGYIRDISNSYAVSMWMMSAEVWVCVLLWCFMPAAIRRDMKKDNFLEEKTDDTQP